jgi:hypothetical protein
MSQGEVRLIAPGAVLERIAAAIPDGLRENIIIIGSLAAGYHYFRDNPRLQVRTKDVDCLLSPRIRAIPAGEAVANRLFADLWELRSDGAWGVPGNAATPDDQLPVVRLHPPGSTEWFVEFLTVPESEMDLGRRDVRIVTSRGHFSLCSFGFLSLAEFQPIPTPFGICIARPETMALANLLHHPAIGPETMSGLIRGRRIKRSNKDLGRVLALACLAESNQEDALLGWARIWSEALQSRFPRTWRDFVPRVGDGLRQLLQPGHEADLEEARHTCEHGLLVSQAPSLKLLQITGKRLLQDAVEPFEKLAMP